MMSILIVMFAYYAYIFLLKYCSAILIIPPMVDLFYTLTDIQERPTAGVLILTPSLTWLAMVIIS